MTQQLTGLVFAEERGTMELTCPCCGQSHEVEVLSFEGMPLSVDGDAIWWTAWCAAAMNWIFSQHPLPSWHAR